MDDGKKTKDLELHNIQLLNDLEVDQYFKFKNMNFGLKTDDKNTKKKISDLHKKINNCNKVIE